MASIIGEMDGRDTCEEAFFTGNRPVFQAGFHFPYLQDLPVGGSQEFAVGRQFHLGNGKPDMAKLNNGFGLRF